MIKSSSMKSSLKNIPVEITVIFALFLIFFALFMITAKDDEEKEVIHYLSTNELGVYGASRMMTLAQKSNINVDRFTLDIINDIPQDTGIIFILCPEIRLSSEEKISINKWIQSGGTLVYGNNIRHLIDHSFPANYDYSEDTLFLDDHQLFIITSEISDNEIPVVLESSDEDDGVKVAVINPESDDLIFMKVNQIHSPFFFHDDSLKQIYFSVPKKESDEGDETGVEWDVLASDNNMPSIVCMKSGEGRIIAIANPLIFSNGFLESGDNILFAYNLMNSLPDGRTVLFDEYHHGFSTIEQRSILETGWGRALAMILIVGIIAIYAKAVRFVPPRAVPPPQRRSQVEYLRSMAQILRKAKALKVISRIMLRDFRSAQIKSDSANNLESALVKEASKERPSQSRIYSTIIKMMGMEKR